MTENNLKCFARHSEYTNGSTAADFLSFGESLLITDIKKVHFSY